MLFEVQVQTGSTVWDAQVHHKMIQTSDGKMGCVLDLQGHHKMIQRSVGKMCCVMDLQGHHKRLQTSVGKIGISPDAQRHHKRHHTSVGKIGVLDAQGHHKMSCMSNCKRIADFMLADHVSDNAFASIAKLACVDWVH